MTRLQQRAQLAMSQVKIMHNVGANPEIEGYKKYKEQEQKFKAHLKKQTIASKNSIKKGRGGEQKMTADHWGNLAFFWTKKFF